MTIMKTTPSLPHAGRPSSGKTELALLRRAQVPRMTQVQAAELCAPWMSGETCSVDTIQRMEIGRRKTPPLILAIFRARTSPAALRAVRRQLKSTT